MITNPIPGQTVQIWYAVKRAHHFPHHGKTAVVETASKGKPRNHLVCLRFSRALVVVPCGNLRPPRPYLCAVCKDTHLMDWVDDSGDSRKVLCTHCPLPCPDCREGGTGPYCGATPCDCQCHTEAAP